MLHNLQEGQFYGWRKLKYDRRPQGTLPAVKNSAVYGQSYSLKLNGIHEGVFHTQMYL